MSAISLLPGTLARFLRNNGHTLATAGIFYGVLGVNALFAWRSIDRYLGDESTGLGFADGLLGSSVDGSSLGPLQRVSGTLFDGVQALLTRQPQQGLIFQQFRLFVVRFVLPQLLLNLVIAAPLALLAWTRSYGSLFVEAFIRSAKLTALRAGAVVTAAGDAVRLTRSLFSWLFSAITRPLRLLIRTVGRLLNLIPVAGPVLSGLWYMLWILAAVSLVAGIAIAIVVHKRQSELMQRADNAWCNWRVSGDNTTRGWNRTATVLRRMADFWNPLIQFVYVFIALLLDFDTPEVPIGCPLAPVGPVLLCPREPVPEYDLTECEVGTAPFACFDWRVGCARARLRTLVRARFIDLVSRGPRTVEEATKLADVIGLAAEGPRLVREILVDRREEAGFPSCCFRRPGLMCTLATGRVPAQHEMGDPACISDRTLCWVQRVRELLSEWIDGILFNLFPALSALYEAVCTDLYGLLGDLETNINTALADTINSMNSFINVLDSATFGSITVGPLTLMTAPNIFECISQCVTTPLGCPGSQCDGDDTFVLHETLTAQLPASIDCEASYVGTCTAVSSPAKPAGSDCIECVSIPGLILTGLDASCALVGSGTFDELPRLMLDALPVPDIPPADFLPFDHECWPPMHPNETLVYQNITVPELMLCGWRAQGYKLLGVSGNHNSTGANLLRALNATAPTKSELIRGGIMSGTALTIGRDNYCYSFLYRPTMLFQLLFQHSANWTSATPDAASNETVEDAIHNFMKLQMRCWLTFTAGQGINAPLLTGNSLLWLDNIPYFHDAISALFALRFGHDMIASAFPPEDLPENNFLVDTVIAAYGRYRETYRSNLPAYAAGVPVPANDARLARRRDYVRVQPVASFDEMLHDPILIPTGPRPLLSDRLLDFIPTISADLLPVVPLIGEFTGQSPTSAEQAALVPFELPTPKTEFLAPETVRAFFQDVGALLVHRNSTVFTLFDLELIGNRTFDFALDPGGGLELLQDGLLRCDQGGTVYYDPTVNPEGRYTLACSIVRLYLPPHIPFLTRTVNGQPWLNSTIPWAFDCLEPEPLGPDDNYCQRDIPDQFDDVKGFFRRSPCRRYEECADIGFQDMLDEVFWVLERVFPWSVRFLRVQVVPRLQNSLDWAGIFLPAIVQRPLESGVGLIEASVSHWDLPSGFPVDSKRRVCAWALNGYLFLGLLLLLGVMLILASAGIALAGAALGSLPGVIGFVRWPTTSSLSNRISALENSTTSGVALMRLDADRLDAWAVQVSQRLGIPAPGRPAPSAPPVGSESEAPTVWEWCKLAAGEAWASLRPPPRYQRQEDDAGHEDRARLIQATDSPAHEIEMVDVLGQ